MTVQNTPEEFGAYLRGVRELAGLTLRDVEQRTNQVVKNGYLSQIEKGLIGRPSPGILYEIAQVYQLSYRDLLLRVGHRVPDEKAQEAPALSGFPLHLIADLDEEEQQALLEYAAYLRHKKKGR
ncbi:helix-turn-helix transcriptional regulator [Catellatospora sp. NPDC049609]|uniref:helix-turn-helix domain-containing protein n=1 Tax=Catellatospora sp. NPDC049609 TaxID=3155505 RepID=UPI003426886F